MKLSDKKTKTIKELQQCFQKSAQEIFNNILSMGSQIPDAIQNKQHLLGQALSETDEEFANIWSKEKRPREDTSTGEEPSAKRHKFS